MKKKLAGLLIALFVLVIVQSGKGQSNPPDRTIDPTIRNQIIDGIILNLNKSYIFPETAKAMENDLRQRVQNKEYDSITSARDLAKKLTTDLRGISKDGHLAVQFSYQPLPVRKENGQPTVEEIEAQNRFYRQVNYGLERVERLEGNVGYIEVRNFWDAELAAETIAAAMSFVSNTNALIFDLRRNGGGEPETVALICSYLFGDKAIHLNNLYFREKNETTEFWTTPKVISKKYGDKNVYVLTSNYTFSAGEEFAYNLKNLKRATIVGETTGGGANPNTQIRLNDHFAVYVPNGRAINPITKTNWEGTGVAPDISVSKEQALKTAHLLALNKLLEKATDEKEINSLKNLIEKIQK